MSAVVIQSIPNLGERRLREFGSRLINDACLWHDYWHVELAPDSIHYNVVSTIAEETRITRKHRCGGRPTMCHTVGWVLDGNWFKSFILQLAVPVAHIILFVGNVIYQSEKAWYPDVNWCSTNSSFPFSCYSTPLNGIVSELDNLQCDDLTSGGRLCRRPGDLIIVLPRYRSTPESQWRMRWIKSSRNVSSTVGFGLIIHEINLQKVRMKSLRTDDGDFGVLFVVFLQQVETCEELRDKIATHFSAMRVKQMQNHLSQLWSLLNTTFSAADGHVKILSLIINPIVL